LAVKYFTQPHCSEATACCEKYFSLKKSKNWSESLFESKSIYIISPYLMITHLKMKKQCGVHTAFF